MKPLLRLARRLLRGWYWLTRPLTVGVRLVLLRGGEVLLVRHTYQRQWALPGGGVDRGETLEAAARREAAEELGARLGGLRLLGVYTNFLEYKSDHVAVFTCEDFDLAGPSRGQMEIECWQFFPLNALPQELMPGHRRRLEELRQGAERPGFGAW